MRTLSSLRERFQKSRPAQIVAALALLATSFVLSALNPPGPRVVPAPPLDVVLREMLREGLTAAWTWVGPPMTFVWIGVGLGIYMGKSAWTSSEDGPKPKPAGTRRAWIAPAVFVGVVAFAALLARRPQDAAGIVLVLPAFIASLIFSVVGAETANNISGRTPFDRGFAMLAARLGFRYSEGDPVGLKGLPFDLFAGASLTKVRNVMVGDYGGMPVTAFTYQRSTRVAPLISKGVVRFACVVSETSLGAPHLVIARRTTPGDPDPTVIPVVEMESGDLNREFRVQCSDREFAFAVLDVQVIGWLLDTPGDWSFELYGPRVLCYAPLREADRLEELFLVLRAFRGRIPPLVGSFFPEKPASAEPPELPARPPSRPRPAFNIVSLIANAVLAVWAYAFLAVILIPIVFVAGICLAATR